jgi:hypothetical protein
MQCHQCLGINYWIAFLKKKALQFFFIFIAIEKFEMLIRISIQSLPTSKWSLNRILKNVIFHAIACLGEKSQK